MQNADLVNQMIESGAIKSKPVIDAFLAVDRKDFAGAFNQLAAYEDMPLSIGFGATISQPSTVGFMLELLEVEPGDGVLDVGCGSGYTTALLSHLSGKSGKVYGVELVPELAEFGQSNLAKAGIKNAEVFSASAGVLGLPDKQPFERILVSAAGEEVPQALIDQLSAGGIMVIPIRSSILRIAKKDDGSVESEGFYGFAFVPLRT